jgi:hypothetical protein
MKYRNRLKRHKRRVFNNYTRTGIGESIEPDEVPEFGFFGLLIERIRSFVWRFLHPRSDARTV